MRGAAIAAHIANAIRGGIGLLSDSPVQLFRRKAQAVIVIVIVERTSAVVKVSGKSKRY
jgi:hypothetical protein